MALHLDWDGGDGTGGGSGGGGGGVGGGGAVSTSDPRVIEFGRLLMALGEGPGVSLVNGLKSVYLDDTPIQSAAGSFNFKGVSVAMTSGTNTQGVIPGFIASESEIAVGVKVVNATPIIRSIATTGLSAVRVRIKVPSLKVINSQTGAESGASVTIKIERQRTGYNAGAYEIVTLDNAGVISGKFGSVYTKSYRIELPNVGTGAWSIRVTRVTVDHTSGAPDYTQDETWWDSYTELTDGRFRYPNTACLAVLVDAKQFSSIPRVSADVNLGTKLVPTNYTPASQDPTTGVWTAATYATTGPGTTGGLWDGTFKQAFTRNPAWAFYDLATSTRYGAGNYLTASRIDKWALYAISQVCDAFVSDGKGGNEPRFFLDLYLQAQEDAIKVLTHLASAFRGMCYWAGGLVTPVQDVDASPVEIFTAANTQDGFSYSGTALKARHTAVLVGWQNPAQGYRQSVEYVEDPAAIARYGLNTVQVAGYGVTSQGLARRLGLWTLLTEKLETETVSFSSGMEGSNLRPGQIIQVQDPFRAGLVRMGGRVASATTTAVTIDAPVTLGAGSYTLKCKLPNGTVESKTLTNVAGSTSVLTVGTAFSQAPEGAWILQSGTTQALYRVIGIRETDPLKYEVMALLHDPTKYSLVETGLVVTPPPAGGTSAYPPVTALTASSSIRVMNDQQTITLAASWTAPAIAVGGATVKSYVAEYSRDSTPWVPMTVAGAASEALNVAPGSYVIRVIAKYAGGVSAPATTTLTVGDTTGTDDYVGPGRKREIKATWDRIKAEQTTLDAQAVTAGVSSTTYDTAISSLFTFLDGLTDIGGGAGLAWTTNDWTNYAVTCYLGAGGGATLRSDLAAVYSARDALVSAIGVTAIVDDVLTGPLKTIIKGDRDKYYNGFYTTTTGLKDEAISAGVSWTACDTAIQALETQLGTYTSADGWNTTTHDWKTLNTLILATGGGATLRSKRADVVTQWNVLSGLISNALSTTATNALAAAPAQVSSLPATCGAEYITLAANRDFSAAGAWTGTGWNIASGAFSHTAGANAATLPNTALTASPANGEGYQISFDVTTTTPGSLTVTFGGVSGSATPYTEGTVTDHIEGISTTGAGTGLIITPDASWVGSIDNVSVKKTQSPGANYPSGKLVWLTANWTDASGVVGPTNKLWPTTIYKSDLTGNVWRWKVGATMADQIIGKLVAGQISAGAIGANALAALLILTNDIRSFNYTAGTSGAAPVGYRLSGVTFTTTYKDGTTASCQLELGDNANIAGYKALTIADRTFFAQNRLLNGWLYKTLLPWNAGGTNSPTYNGIGPVGSYYGSARHSTVVASAGNSTTKTGDISQAVILPKSGTAASTVLLTCQTGYTLPVNCDSTGTYIKAYIFDPGGSGTETLVGTRTYNDASGLAHGLSWDTNSWDISSYVGAGGTFGIRFEMSAVIRNNDSISHNMDLCLGNIAIVI